MSENNDTSSESNSIGSDSVLQASRLNTGANPILRTGVLRPSVLDTAAISSAASSSDIFKVSKPETVKNPFNKDFADKKVDSEPGEAAAVETLEATADTPESTKESAKENDAKAVAEEEEHDLRPDPMTMLRKNGLERSNLFAAAKNSIPRVQTSGFVFGENVHERVVGENINVDGSNKADVNSNGSNKKGDLLFSSVIQNAANDTNIDGTSTSLSAPKDSEAKSLNDVAREYEESRGAQKRKFEEVETFTGEENEQNIVEVNCKLFAFINSNWEERGRGSLRLNESKKDNECSRVVFRTSGNLRLILNTKVWAGMIAERPSQKSLRLTAMDATGKIKIFLVMGRPADMTLLHSALVERIELRKTTHPDESNFAGPVEEETKNGSSAAVSSTVDDDVAEFSEGEESVTPSDEQVELKNKNGNKADSSTKVLDDELADEPSPKKKVIVTDENN